MKRIKKVISLLCVFMILITCISNIFAGVHAESQSIGCDITNWTMDETNGYIYAISYSSKKLLFIRLDSLLVEKEINLESNPSDIDIKGMMLYIPLESSKKIVVINIEKKEIEKELNLTNKPYKVAFDGDKLFYTEGDQWCYLYEYNLTSGKEKKIGLSFYNPDIVADESKHILYVGEYGGSASSLFSISTTDYTITKEAKDSFGPRERKVILDGQDIFFATAKVNSDNVSEIHGSYTGQVTYVKGNYVFSLREVFDRNKYVKISDLPSYTKLVLMDSKDNVYLFDSDKRIINREKIDLSLNSTQNHKVLGNKLLLDKTIDNWVYDDTKNYIYAISKKSNKLLYIKADEMNVEGEKYIGSMPADIKLANGKLYISLSGSTKVAVTGTSLSSEIEEIHLDINPYKIAVGKDKLFYTDIGLTHRVRVYDFYTGQCKVLDNMFFQYAPNIAIDYNENILYAGDQTKLFAVKTSDYAIISENRVCIDWYDDLIADNGDLYCKGHRINGRNLSEKKGSYLNLEQGDKINDSEKPRYLITGVQGDYVLSKYAVYDKERYFKICDLPEYSNRVIIGNQNNTYLLDETNMVISKVNLNLVPIDVENHGKSGNKLLLDEPITDWVFDEDKRYIYAVSMERSKLLYIRYDDMTVEGEKFIGSLPKDIELYDGKIYVALEGSNDVAVTGTTIESGISKINLDGSPLLIEVGKEKIFYVRKHQYGQGVFCYDLSSHGITLVMDGNKPEIEIDNGKGILYIGQLYSSHSRLYAVSTSDFHLISQSEQYDTTQSRVVLDNGNIYYAKSCLDSNNLKEVKSYGEDIIYAKDQYVFSKRHIYDKNSGNIVESFGTNKSLVYFDNNSENKYIYDSDCNTILKIRSIVPEASSVKIISEDFYFVSEDGSVASEYSTEIYDQYEEKMGNESVTWAVYNNDNTCVNTIKVVDGGLIISDLASPGKYYIKATSCTSPEISGKMEFSVEDIRLSKIIMNGNSNLALPNSGEKSYNYNLSLLNNKREEMRYSSANWGVFMGCDSQLIPVPFISIDDTGKLSISKTTIPGKYIIAAQIHIDDKKIISLKEINITEQSQESGTTHVGDGSAVPVVIPPSPAASETGPVSPTPILTATQSPTQTPAPKTTPTATSVNIREQTDKIPSTIVFSDIVGHWAERYVTKLVEKKIIDGYPDNSIKPDNDITRSELVAIIIKALNLKSSENYTQMFADNDEIPGWVKGYLQIAVDKGIITGYKDGTFRPLQRCSRNELVTMIMRAFSFGESDKEQGFTDFGKVPAWSKKSISKAIEMEIIKGYSDNTFRPDRNVTRAEAFAILVRCLDKNKGV